MSPQTQIDPIQEAGARWNPALRLGFRFCFVYFVLFCLSNQIFASLFPLQNVEIPDPSTLWPIRQIVFWTAAHVFHAKLPLVYTDSGSGDKTFDWVLTFCLLVAAVIGTAIWSALDRRRENYATLYKWFRVFMRFALASQMLVYGMGKVIPLQMPYPYLTRLLEPWGNSSPMGVLWYSIGSAPAYEIFAGSAEMLGGILLILPRTALFGALVSLADMIQVFALNMTYDVPVKLFSFHLILMSLFLLAPHFGRLANVFFLNRNAEPHPEPQLFRSRRANRMALAAQVLFGVFLAGMNTHADVTSWSTHGGGRPKPALYGIWDVNEMSVDGESHPPLATDKERWRRVIFDFPTRITFERPDDSFSGFGSSIDTKNNTLALTKDADKKWKASFNFTRAARDRLTLDGEMDGHKIHMQLQMVDRDKFLLVRRGFHWIQEYPFNR